VNLRTGKPLLRAGYAASTVNHALTVVSSFYAFHLHYGRGPVINPVPVRAERRHWTLHDLRHTAAARMAADPSLTLVEVQHVRSGW
jgi:hypothetical protein